MKHWWLLIAFLFGHELHAQDTILGIGFGPSLDSGNTTPHMMNVELEHDWSEFALIANGMSFWETPTLYAISVLPTVKVITPGGILVRCGFGVGVITHLDDRLSSPYEFNIQCAVGVTAGWAEILAEFNHVSDGSPVLGPGPNLGRDTISAHLGFRVF